MCSVYFLHAIIIELSQQAHYLKNGKISGFLYSSSRITDELNCLIQSNGLKNGVFRRTRHLIQYHCCPV